ncbi:hypothetical protein PGT21_010454 [Puccinia graminis f. sp. tritici]|uniref:Uncharacterized protein n=1 Tax=Puccinia graminis f. sp. tritici TaxID=56615 RepID=A0A5B0LRG5_PUCGR|nr:hypothetical protein PGT21_010454 [Puccinia graminis f. sp. tritici]
MPSSVLVLMGSIQWVGSTCRIAGVGMRYLNAGSLDQIHAIPQIVVADAEFESLRNSTDTLDTS